MDLFRTVQAEDSAFFGTVGAPKEPDAENHGEWNGDDLLVAAMESLPRQWQSLLGHVEVLGREPEEIVPLLGLDGDGINEMLVRARTALWQAYGTEDSRTD